MRPTIAEIQCAVAERYRLPAGAMTAPARVRELAWPRQVAMFLARRLVGVSYPRIGERFGGRHHTTVIHAERAVASRAARDTDLQADLAALTQRLSPSQRQGLPQSEGAS